MPAGGLPGAVGRVRGKAPLSTGIRKRGGTDPASEGRPFWLFPDARTLPRRAGRWFHHARGKQRIRTRRQSETGSDYIGLVPVVGLEPTRGISPTDFESVTSANSITPARMGYYSILVGGEAIPGGGFFREGVTPSPPAAPESRGTARRPGTPEGRWAPAPSMPSPRTGQRARRRGSAPGAGRTGTG